MPKMPPKRYGYEIPRPPSLESSRIIMHAHGTTTLELLKKIFPDVDYSKEELQEAEEEIAWLTAWVEAEKKRVIQREKFKPIEEERVKREKLFRSTGKCSVEN